MSAAESGVEVIGPRMPIGSFATLQPRRPASPLVIRAADSIAAGLPRRALDLGAGALSNARFLLGSDYAVEAVDIDPVTAELATEIGHPRLDVTVADIHSFPIRPGHYSLVVAIHVLQFLPKADVWTLLADIRTGLTEGGVLCCTLLGERDGWAECSPPATTFTRSECADLLSGFTTLDFNEVEYDGCDATGGAKHWHVFRMLVRRG